MTSVSGPAKVKVITIHRSSRSPDLLPLNFAEQVNVAWNELSVEKEPEGPNYIHSPWSAL